MTDPKPKFRPDGTAAESKTPRRRPLGQWLAETMPRSADVDPLAERHSDRAVSFADGGAA